MLTKISSKINFIGGMLTLIVVSNIALSIYINQKREGDSYIINIAGRQRMLSQKITKEIYYIKNSEHFDFQKLDSDMDMFEENLLILINGNKKLHVYKPPTKEIRDKLDEVLNIWKPFKKRVKEIEKNIKNIKKDKEIMMNRFDELLMISDKVVKEMLKAKMHGNYIDLSGRQRMLSQRMGLYFVRFLDTNSQSYYYTYYEAMKMYDRTLNSFIIDKKVKEKKELYKIVSKNYNSWHSFKNYIEELMKREINISNNIEYIHHHNVKLLKNMDEAVWLYTDYSQQKSSYLKTFLYVIAVLALLIIFYTYFTSRALEKHVTQFVNRTRKLGDVNPLEDKTPLILDSCEEDELKEVSTHINKFADRVKFALKNSDEALFRAKMAAKELQNIADSIEETLEDMGVKSSDSKGLEKNIDETEDIAIESAESLIQASKMIQKLKNNLTEIFENYPKH